MITGLEHIAITVDDLDQAVELWENITGGQCIHKEEVIDQGVMVATIECGTLLIELLNPTSCTSPVGKFISQHGTGIHHLALRTNSAEAEFARLRDLGLRFIDEQVKIGADNSKICFIHPRSAGGVLVEIVEPTQGVSHK
jgi:methylmalonyl-CoA/ethylmalonyl-CoA epimerase